MPKRKVSSESEDEASFSDADSKPKKKQKTTPKKKPAPKKAKPESPDTDNSPTNKQAETSKDGHTKVLTTAEGDKYIDLGKKKRATVRSFKNIPLLDIREFWGADEKPGKKGISLTLEQWQMLKSNVDTIDELFTDLTK